MNIPVIDAYKVTLRPFQEEDLECVRIWRNSISISQWMLSKESISGVQQKLWFEQTRFDPTQWHFVVWFRNERLGVVNLKSLDALPIIKTSKAETGLYIGDENFRGNFISFCPALALNDYCFENLAINCLEARVLNENEAALKFNKALGYEITDRNDTITYMQLNKQNYFNTTGKIKRLIR